MLTGFGPLPLPTPISNFMATEELNELRGCWRVLVPSLSPPPSPILWPLKNWMNCVDVDGFWSPPPSPSQPPSPILWPLKNWMNFVDVDGFWSPPSPHPHLQFYGHWRTEWIAWMLTGFGPHPPPPPNPHLQFYGHWRTEWIAWMLTESGCQPTPFYLHFHGHLWKK